MWNTILNGLKYAFFGNGGFNVEKGFQQVYILKMDELDKYDVTNSIQVTFDVRALNEKLGLYKNANNNGVLSTSYNNDSDSFNVDSVSISALEFISGITHSNITSLGSLTSLYSDFNNYLTQYFNNKGGFTDTFTLSKPININDGIFDVSSFMYLLHRSTRDESGNYVSDLSGTVIFNDINNTLREVVCMNIFGNRDMSASDISGVIVRGTACDPNNPYNYRVADGFIEGDLLFIPNGITITLTIGISNNKVVLNDSGKVFLDNLNLQTNYTRGYFSKYNKTTPTNITRIVTTPLLIKLKNESTSIFKYTDRIDRLIKLTGYCHTHEVNKPDKSHCHTHEVNKSDKSHCYDHHSDKCHLTELEKIDRLDLILKLMDMGNCDKRT